MNNSFLVATDVSDVPMSTWQGNSAGNSDEPFVSMAGHTHYTCTYHGGCCAGNFPYLLQTETGFTACSHYADCHQTTVCAHIGGTCDENNLINSCLNGIEPRTGFSCQDAACPQTGSVAPSSPTGVILLAVLASAAVGSLVRYWKKSVA